MNCCLDTNTFTQNGKSKNDKSRDDSALENGGL